MPSRQAPPARPRLARTRPTARGWVLAAAGAALVVVGLVLSLSDVLALGAAALVLVAGAGVRLATRRLDRGRHALTVRRTLAPAPVVRGRTTTATLVLGGTGRSPAGDAGLARLQVSEQASREVCGDEPLRARVARSEGRMTVRYAVRPQARGRWALGPVIVTRTDVFGVARAQQRLGATTEVTVWPATVPLTVPRSGTPTGSEHVVAGTAAASSEDTLVREYVVGDDPRRVHWSSVARHGRLMVRAEESAGLPSATVLVDRALLLPGAGTTDAGEWAVDLAASVALALHRAGYRTRLLGTSDGAPAAGYSTPRTTTGAAHILDAATDLTTPASLDHARTELVATAAALRHDTRRDELVVAVLAPPSARATSELAVLGTATQRAVVVDGAGSDGGAGTDASDEPLAALRSVGWTVARVRAGTPIALAWAAASAGLHERGASA
ncbi:DUF58 domain-containing protein [Cellulomonas sp. PhB143]|uniref:DUF58 domain-containing protein n=1 Tax=Cellulomonas sp. PhB143 TaxID=2485186 RepID=UPI000F460BBF|nr:DUF58 domain-containing protein [Cellulomonas sp. PhB143]ROS77202.1 uncharacterized protein DUF58 [Cellulomonas sp. PhB143]